MKYSFYCGYCTKQFDSVRKLQRHTKRVHQKKKPISIGSESRRNVCPHCGLRMVFSRFQTFISHLRTCIANAEREAGGSRPPYICRTCGQRFRRKDNLKTHKKRVHSASAIADTKDGAEKLPEGFEKHCYDLLSGTISPELLVFVSSVTNREIKSLKARGTKTTFRFTPLSYSLAKYGYFPDVLEIVFGDLIRSHNLREPGILVDICLDSEDQLSYPIKMPLINSQDFDLTLFLMSIESVCQSRIALGMEGDLSLEITTCPDPTYSVGNAGYRLLASKVAEFSEFLHRKKGLLDPLPLQNFLLENGCVPLCVAIALYSDTKGNPFTHDFWKRKQKKLPYKAQRYVLEFYRTLSLEYGSQINCDQETLCKIQLWLQEKYSTRLLVHSVTVADLRQIQLVFSGPLKLTKEIHLLLFDSHCWLVVNRDQVFKPYFYCMECELVHQNGVTCPKRPKVCHLCKSTLCFINTGLSAARTVHCEDCHKWFKNGLCYRQHNLLKTCEKEKRCYACGKLIKPERVFSHACGTYFCKVCCLWADQSHRCFIQPYVQKPTKEDQIYIFADLEAKINQETKCHEIILAVAVRVCERCIHILDSTVATSCCPTREFYFYGKESLKEFVIWLGWKNKNAICFCHFGGGYDFVHILEELLRLRHRPKVITRNLRIIQMEFGLSIKCHDTYNIFRCALRKLPKMFGLEVNKEWFPFKFLTSNSLNYVGPWPEMDQYDVKEAERPQFLEHYKNQQLKHPQFSMKDRLGEYCKMDVLVLWHSCSKLYQQLYQLEKLNPLFSLSISSLTSTIYRAKYLPPDPPIAVIYDFHDSARWTKMQSEIAYHYLSYLHSLPGYADLEHAGNKAREVRIMGKLVDGYSKSKREIVEVALKTYYRSAYKLPLQVLGCFYHAHLDPSCPEYNAEKEDQKHPLYKPMTYEEVYIKSADRLHKFESQNYKVTMVWECEIRKLLKTDQNFSKFVSNYKETPLLGDPIEARSALFGGRTGANYLLVTINETLLSQGWKLEYYDIASMYADVMMKCNFPVSHPVIRNQSWFPNKGSGYSKADVDSNLAIYKCRVLFKKTQKPPIFPALPFRVNNKLMFPICGSCASASDNEAECVHEEGDRCMDGCWTSVELSRAMTQGFEIVRMYQAWIFYESSDQIFVPYMKTYAKLKFKASGFPDNVITEKEKDDFLQLLRDEMDIELTKDQIENNPALRNFAKSILVNLWGKLGESCEKTGRQCHFIDTEEEFIKTLKLSRTEPVHMKILTDKFMLVETKTKKEYLQPNRFHNPVISTFVTAYGRLMLLDVLERLGNLVLYFDTDSCIFAWQENGVGSSVKPETGEVFGTFKSELEPGEFGLKFLSLAPKMYALLTNRNRLIFRAKGLVLTQDVQENMDFETMTALLTTRSDEAKQFYDRLEDKSLGQRLKIEHQRRVDAAGWDEKMVGLVLPDPTVTRNWKKNEPIRSDEARTKNLRFTFSKRRICSRSECLQYTPPFRIGTHPWGFSHHQ